AKVRKDFDDAAARERQASNEEENDAHFKSLLQAQDAVQAHEREIKSIRTVAFGDRLKSMGLSDAAELAAIDEQAAAKKAALRRQIEDQAKTIDPALRSALKASGEEEEKAIEEGRQSAKAALRKNRR